MVCLNRPYSFKFFKGCLPQISLGPFLNTLSHMKLSFSCYKVHSSFLHTVPNAISQLFSDFAIFFIFQIVTSNNEHVWTTAKYLNVLHHNRTQKQLRHFFLNILQKYYQFPVLGTLNIATSIKNNNANLYKL